MITNSTCCEPQELSIDNTSGYLSISDGNSVYLGTLIQELGIKTPVINYVLNGYLLTLTYTDINGAIQNKTVDLTALAQGGSLTAVNTNSLDLTIASAVLSGNVNISGIPGNTLSVRTDGLFSSPYTPTPLTTTNTSTLSLVNNSSNLSGSVLISQTANNKIQSLSDGIFVGDMTTYLLPGTNVTLTGAGSSTSPYIISAGGFVNVPLSVVNSTTLSLSTSGVSAHTLTGHVNVSSSVGNAIVTNSDGLFVPQVNFTPYTDAQARAAISATTPINYNSSTGVISIIQSGSGSNGYLSSTDWNIFNNKVSNGISLGSTSSLPIYAGNASGVLQFNGIRAGANITLSLVGNDIVITGVIAPPSTSSATLDFIVGDGGTFTPVNGASNFSPSILLNKTILGVWVEGVKIAGVPRTAGALYYTFVSSTASFTLTNGTFSTDSYYSIEYR